MLIWLDDVSPQGYIIHILYIYIYCDLRLIRCLTQYIKIITKTVATFSMSVLDQ